MILRAHCLYCSPTLVRVIRSRKISWTEHAARMEESNSVIKILIGKPIGKGPLGRCVDERTLTESISKK